MAYYTVDTLIVLLSITAIDRARSTGRFTLQWWYFTTLGAMSKYLRPLKNITHPMWRYRRESRRNTQAGTARYDGHLLRLWGGVLPPP